MNINIFELQSLLSPGLLSVTASFVILMLAYTVAWRRAFSHASEFQTIWFSSFMYALRFPGYLTIIVVWLYQVLHIFSEPLLKLFDQFGSILKLMLPVSFSLLIFIIFNKFLSNIQAQIVRIEKNQPFPNSAALITACKLGRLVSGLVFLIVVLYAFEIPMGQILAPTAVGALALSFASKDVLSNVFGGIMVMCDRPFVVGDYVSIRPGEEGTVRYVGWRVTEIQLQNGRILHVPNGLLATTIVTNYSEKAHWFVQKEVGIRYQDISVAKSISEELEAWVINHKLANKRRAHFARVYHLGDSSIVMRVRAYLKSSINTKEWYQFNEELVFKVNDVVKKHGADFAFPSRTVYMDKGDDE